MSDIRLREAEVDAKATGDLRAWNQLQFRALRAGVLERDPRLHPVPGDEVRGKGLSWTTRRVVACPPVVSIPTADGRGFVIQRQQPSDWRGRNAPFSCGLLQDFVLPCPRIHWKRILGGGPRYGTLFRRDSWVRWARGGEIQAFGWARKQKAKQLRPRVIAHLDRVPHSVCDHPERCACECPGCLQAWTDAGCPGPVREEWVAP